MRLAKDWMKQSVRGVAAQARRAMAGMLLVGLLANTGWAQRELKDIPVPDPELERKSFVVADGFEVNLFAADPLMAKPIHMNFDAQGRLWIASSEVYPQIKPGQKATDKILVLEDTNGDGQADKTTVFAEGLLIPTGLAPDNKGGAYVVNSTELIHLIDRDGDGKADDREIVLSGFGTEDTHHLLHTLRWGPDGCLYMNQSIYIHSHVETPYGVNRLNGGGIWRFRPETLELEVLAYGLVNSWGHHFDRFGQSFATDGAGGEGINYVFPGSVFVTAPGAVRVVQGLNPGSPKHCGLEILSGTHLPESWRGTMVANDFRAHRVCRFTVTEDGSGFASRQESEVIKTTHVAFRPIDVKHGSDGAIYIADWYNPIIQHGEVDFRDERRDHVHGRIWRVSAKGSAPLKTAIAANAKVTDLVALLSSGEEWTRTNAKLLLKERDPAEVKSAITDWIGKLNPESADYESLLLEGLWAREACRLDDEGLVAKLLKAKDHRVRAAAVRYVSHGKKPGDSFAGSSVNAGVATLEEATTALTALQAAAADSNPRVRLEAVRALALLPRTAVGKQLVAAGRGLEIAQAAASVLDQPQDRFLDFAIWQAMRDLAPVWLPAVKEGSFDFGGSTTRLTFALKAVDSPDVVPPLLRLLQEDKIADNRVDSVLSLVAQLGGAKELASVLKLVVDADSKLSPDRKATILMSLVDTTRIRKTVPTGDLNPVVGLLASPNAALKSAACQATGIWKLEGARAGLEAIASGGADISPALQGSAMEGLALLGGDASKAALSKLARTGGKLEVRQRAIAATASLDVPAAAAELVELLAESPEGLDPAGAAGALLARSGGAPALTQALANKKLKADTAKLVLRAARAAAQPSDELIVAAQKAGGLEAAVWKPTPEFVAQLVAEVKEKGNPEKGEAIYRSGAMQCMKCHAIGGAGGAVGPDMVSIGASAQVDYLVESLLEPAKKVKEGYHSQTIVTDEGLVVTGIPVRESPTELVMRQADDKLVTVSKDSIETRKDGRSLMPDGLADSLTRTELVDLIRFLSELGKVGGNYAIGKTPVVRRWESLIWTPEAHTLINRSSYDSAAGTSPALSWEPAYSRVGGDLPVNGLPQFVAHAGYDPHSFVRFQLEVSSPGVVSLALGKPNGVTLWVDGKPTPVASVVNLELGPGRHTLTLGVNRQKRIEPLTVELAETPKGATAAQVQIIGGK